MYTTSDIQYDERRSEQEEMMSEFRDSYDVFAEAEKLSTEEEHQQMIEKLTLLTMGVGIVGIGVWFALRSRKLQKAIGVAPAASSGNVNTSKHLQAAIGQDRERQLVELEKLRLKEEKERAHAERILESVQRRRVALAEEELAREEAEREEREAQREHARLRREQQLSNLAAGNGDGVDIEKRYDPLASDETGQPPHLLRVADSRPNNSVGDGLSNAFGSDTLDENGDVYGSDDAVPKRSKPTGVFNCKPCKKTFKSEEQLENHFASKKHKQVLKEMEKATARGE